MSCWLAGFAGWAPSGMGQVNGRRAAVLSEEVRSAVSAISTMFCPTGGSGWGSVELLGKTTAARRGRTCGSVPGERRVSDAAWQPGDALDDAREGLANAARFASVLHHSEPSPGGASWVARRSAQCCGTRRWKGRRVGRTAFPYRAKKFAQNGDASPRTIRILSSMLSSRAPRGNCQASPTPAAFANCVREAHRCGFLLSHASSGPDRLSG